MAWQSRSLIPSFKRKRQVRSKPTFVCLHNNSSLARTQSKRGENTELLLQEDGETLSQGEKKNRKEKKRNKIMSVPGRYQQDIAILSR